MTTNGGLTMLSEMEPKLPPSERRIAAFILQHPQESISLTATELGKKSGTSSAAVIRLCKSLDLKGFQDLKLRVAGDLHKKKENGHRDIEPNEDIYSIIEKMTNNSMQTIQETVDLMNTDKLNEAVHALKEANTIHFFGVGASAIIAEDAKQKFIRINKSATALTDVHMVATLIANVKEGDVVFGISFSGETFEVAKILELANQKGATTISLTKYGASLVSEQASIRLYTSTTREPTFRSGATSSRIAQLHMIDILFISVASQRYNESVEYIDQTREAIDFLKARIRHRNRS